MRFLVLIQYIAVKVKRKHNILCRIGMGWYSLGSVKVSKKPLITGQKRGDSVRKEWVKSGYY